MIDTKLKVDLKITVPLRLTDFDRYVHLKPSAVLSLFQEAATRQAELMDIGRKAMARRGAFWVVVRTYYEVIEQPAFQSDVCVRTWPHTPSRFSFLRDYEITTPDGRKLVRGTSEWVLVSLETREFLELSSVYEAPDHLLDERNFERKPRKLKDFDAHGAEPLVVVPTYADLDGNGHVNNSVYADYPFDVMNPSPKSVVRSFQIDYRHEALAGKPLYVYDHLEDGVLFAKGVNEAGEIMFAARVGLGE